MIISYTTVVVRCVAVEFFHKVKWTAYNCKDSVLPQPIASPFVIMKVISMFVWRGIAGSTICLLGGTLRNVRADVIVCFLLTRELVFL